MCEHKADYSNTKTLKIDGEPRNIDKCIFDMVKLLNDNGYPTVASCCGHGHQPVNIALKDGREIIIAPNYEKAREIGKLFPDIHGNKDWNS